jgi:hypothetical protein
MLCTGTCRFKRLKDATTSLVFLPEMVLVVPRDVYSSFRLVVAAGTTCFRSPTKQDLFEPLLVGRDTQ